MDYDQTMWYGITSTSVNVDAPSDVLRDVHNFSDSNEVRAYIFFNGLGSVNIFFIFLLIRKHCMAFIF